MKYRHYIGVIFTSFLISSCGGGGGNSNGGGELTGIWRLDLANILYLLIDNHLSVTVQVCNSDDSFLLSKSNDGLYLNGSKFISTINTTQLELAYGPLAGVKLNKINENSSFNSGSLAIQSSNITDLSATSGVCAYRETDGINNIIAAPYEGGFLEFHIGVNSRSIGNFSIPSEVSISMESEQLPGIFIDGRSGNVDIIEYTDTKLSANFTFTAADSNEYSGSVDVDL